MLICGYVVELFKKAANILRNMITEDKLAAATLAQIFGSELTDIDKKTTHRSSNTPNAVQINPKKILLGDQQNAPRQQQISTLQREAENAFPYSSQPSNFSEQPLPITVPQSSTNQPITHISLDHLERICTSLEKIVAVLEDSNFIIKKQTKYRSENK